MGKLLFPISLIRMLTASATGAVFLPILYHTIACIPLFLTVWQKSDRINDAKFNPSQALESYDFIVVGAGSAGAVVANRLSAHYNVLLLEAGGEPHPLQSIPAFATFLLNYPETDWLHKSVPQTGANLNSVNQQSSWSAGKALGGTGNLNFMLYLRGHKRDFDNWAEITGDPSWSYEGVTPHYKSLETYGDSEGDATYHGFEGDLSVELPDYIGIADEFVKGGQEFGYPEIDVNAPHTEGFFKLFHTTKKGVRHAPYRAFIQTARKRKTLTIRKFAQVNKILFRDGNEEVYGVTYDRHGKTYTALATKEVIVSAGAITSPKLLMLSGIGPRDHLEDLGIPCRHDLPVGKNLQDHTGVYLNPIFIDPPKSLFLDRDVTPKAFAQWFTKGKGVLSSGGCHASAVFSSSLAKARGEGDWPDLQFFLYGFAVHKTFAETFAQAFYLKLDEMQKYYAHAVGKDSFMIAISGSRPVARGDIRLGGSSPYDNILIDPNYLNDKDDVDIRVLLDGTKAALQLVENTTAFQNLNARFTDVPLPGCEHLPFRSDEYWYCYIRRYTVTLHHPSGTAAMGKVGAKNAVVDPELRVQGVRNLRVIDASIMPVLTVTNAQAPSMMIGEKGSSMILKYWQDLEAEMQQQQHGWGWEAETTTQKPWWGK